MSSINNIKISELDPIPAPIAWNDFFPLVDSSSMTTYRVSVAELGPVITSSMHVSSSVSASWASRSLYATSASWASRSLSASHALISDNVSLSGFVNYFPYWTSSGVNGNLKIRSGLSTTRSVQTDYGSGGITGTSNGWNSSTPWIPDPIGHPYYTRSAYFKEGAHTIGTELSSSYGVGGINTGAWPVIAGGFIGADKYAYTLCTESVNYPVENGYTNRFWSGSAASGSYYTIPSGNGQLSSSLNGKWWRIAAVSAFYGPPTNMYAANAPKGECSMAQHSGNGMFGRIKFILNTSMYNGGSNVRQMLDLNIHDELWGGGVAASIEYASVYQKDIIKKIRLTEYAGNSINPSDPVYALDVFIDGLLNEDYEVQLQMYSWGNVRFMTEPNIDPPALVDTGSVSNDPSRASYLIIPPEPGYYCTYGYESVYRTQQRNYNIHGLPVSISPKYNERTGSAWDNIVYRNPYSLNVSGTVNVTDRYYANDQAGQSGIFVSYEPTSANWYNMSYVGGILVASSSTGTSPVGSSASASYASRSTWAETASYYDNPGIPKAWALCVCTSSTTSTAIHYPGTDWHWMHVQSGYNVRGVTKYTASNSANEYLPLDFPRCPTNDSPKSTRISTVKYDGSGVVDHWIVTLNTSMSSTNYMVMGGGGAQGNGGYINMTMFPESKRTTTQFTLSMCSPTAPGFGAGADYINWFTFAVYENPNNIGITYPGWTPYSLPPGPTTPVLNYATPGNQQVSLGWETSTRNPAGTIWYIIKRSLSLGGTYTAIVNNQGTISQSARTFIDTGLDNGTTYYYAISATGSNNVESANSNILSATPSYTPPPETPYTYYFNVTWIAGDGNSQVVVWHPVAMVASVDLGPVTGIYSHSWTYTTSGVFYITGHGSGGAVSIQVYKSNGTNTIQLVDIPAFTALSGYTYNITY